MSLHIFSLHCFFSTISSSKHRPPNFCRQTLWNALKQTFHPSDRVTIVLDEARREGIHFVEKDKDHFPIVCMSGGTGSKAYRNLLDIIQSVASAEQWSDDEIVVFLEDDYAVKPEWQQAVVDGLQFGSYVTLYDHPDKYGSMYENLPSNVFVGSICHWRTTPSTTNSFAVRWKTLQEDMSIHLQFAPLSHPVVQDHLRFLSLWNSGRVLVSSIPSFWSHEESGMRPPFWNVLTPC